MLQTESVRVLSEGSLTLAMTYYLASSVTAVAESTRTRDIRTSKALGVAVPIAGLRVEMDACNLYCAQSALLSKDFEDAWWLARLIEAHR